MMRGSSLYISGPANRALRGYFWRFANGSESVAALGGISKAASEHGK
jgi:hypothetical protein